MVYIIDVDLIGVSVKEDEKIDKKSRKFLLYLPLEIYKESKIRAINKNITMRKWILIAVRTLIEYEKKNGG